MHIRPHNRNLNERLPSRAPRGRGSTKVPILKDLQSTLDQIKKDLSGTGVIIMPLVR